MHQSRRLPSSQGQFLVWSPCGTIQTSTSTELDLIFIIIELQFGTSQKKITSFFSGDFTSKLLLYWMKYYVVLLKVYPTLQQESVTSPPKKNPKKLVNKNNREDDPSEINNINIIQSLKQGTNKEYSELENFWRFKKYFMQKQNVDENQS